MGQITILGTSYAVPYTEHSNTHLLVREGSTTLLVDCPGDAIQRLEQADVALDHLTDIIITHFHPDHAAGIPLFLLDSWVLGRHSPLNLHGLKDTLDRIKKNMDLYQWQDWPGFYPVRFLPVKEEVSAIVMEHDSLLVRASPVQHFLPTICLRFDFLRSGRSLVYSSDTEPCQAVEMLARDVDVLLHEATGAEKGHSSARQAAEIAQKAGAGSLYLIHYPHQGSDLTIMLEEAKSAFNGPVALAQDSMTFNFD